MKNRIAAGIVLYNPDDINRVQQCIESVLEQIEHVYIFDNSVQPVQLLKTSQITYVTKANGDEPSCEKVNNVVNSSKVNKNYGIAYALNRIMERAQQDGFDWVLTMDQDSILPSGMIPDFRNRINSDSGRTAIFCPQVIDKRRAYMKAEKRDCVVNVEECITSASCTSIQAWKDVGGFDEWLFIDLVDNEFCKRLVSSGYQIKRVDRWVLDQEFGKIIPKSKRSQKFWIRLSQLLHNKNIAKFSYRKYVSPLRVYYTNRNIIYVNRKLKAYGPVAYNNYNCKGYPGFIISFNLPSVIRAHRKGQVISAIIRGTLDGLKTHPKPWIKENDSCCM